MLVPHWFLRSSMKPPEIRFTASKMEDMDEILLLINDTGREWYRKIIPVDYYIDPFLTMKQLQEMSESMEFFICRHKDAIIAVGSLSKRNKTDAWIPLMYVQTDFQKIGIGSALIKHLEQLAVERGYAKCILETDSKAEWALNFYKKHGYSVFKKDRTPWGFHVWMKKPLDQLS